MNISEPREALARLIEVLDKYHDQVPLAVKSAHNDYLIAKCALEAKPNAEDERIYPCRECGAMRSKSEGGATFTVCDKCWERKQAKPAAEFDVQKALDASAARFPRDFKYRAAEVMDCCDETKCDWLEAHGDPKVQLMGRLLRQRLTELTTPAEVTELRGSWQGDDFEEVLDMATGKAEVTDEAVREALEFFSASLYESDEGYDDTVDWGEFERHLAIITAALADRERLREDIRVLAKMNEDLAGALVNPAFVRVPREVLERECADYDLSKRLLREYGG